MSMVSLIQLASSCVGIVGALFFAVGVLRQSTETMGRLCGTYWGLNPDMRSSLAAQKADYLFGGGSVTIAFMLQFAAFFAQANKMVFEPVKSYLCCEFVSGMRS